MVQQRKTFARMAVAMMVLALGVAVLATGCSSSSGGATQREAVVAQEDYAYSSVDAEADGLAATEGSADAKAKVSDDATEAEEQNKVVIRSAYVSLSTRSYDDALTSVKKIIDEAGGNITNSSESGGHARTITIDARVDPNKLEETVEKLRNIEGCTIESANISSDDVTRTYNDTERRIEILNEEYEHYKKMLEEATTTEDMLQITDRMYDVMAEIKQYTDARDDMKHDADRSQLSVTLSEEVVAGESSSSSGNFFVDAWDDSWGIFGHVVRGIVYLFIMFLPYLLIAGTIFAIVLIMHRRRRAKKQAAQAAQAEATFENAVDYPDQSGDAVSSGMGSGGFGEASFNGGVSPMDYQDFEAGDGGANENGPNPPQPN
ncbi:MAG: DUF4349 domain-containing protein [Atopobiaceae bacterium]|nr:DUF4349 domain-containing protein [Atopobiaceae bacterium]